MIFMSQFVEAVRPSPKKPKAQMWMLSCIANTNMSQTPKRASMIRLKLIHTIGDREEPGVRRWLITRARTGRFSSLFGTGSPPFTTALLLPVALDMLHLRDPYCACVCVCPCEEFPLQPAPSTIFPGIRQPVITGIGEKKSGCEDGGCEHSVVSGGVGASAVHCIASRHA